MARASGRLVMNGSKDGECSMYVEFGGEAMPHQVRKEGYYLGARTYRDMVEEMSKGSGLQQSTGGSTGVEVVHRPGSVSMDENGATASGDELHKRVESHSSTESRKRGGATPGFNSSPRDMDSVRAVPETSQSVVGVALQVGSGKPVRSVGRAPQRWDSGEEESEVEITDVDEYIVFDGDFSNPVSLCVLPLEFEDKELIDSGVSRTASEVSLCGKSGGLEVMRSVTAWKLTFPGDESFLILVKITDTSGAKRWVKLGKPRSGYKETAEDVVCVARFLAFVKKEPHASEDRLRNHLLDGDVLSVTFCDYLRKRRSLIEQYIDLDPALEKADAGKALLSHTREKVTNTGKRIFLLNDDSSDEDDYPRVKKAKTDHTRPEDVGMREYESEEELYQDEGMSDDDDDDELGDSLCTFCDDGGFLICCDGPCMRSFHPRPKDGINTNCGTLTFPDSADIEVTKKDWFCKNCKAKKHQCYICGELGASDEALGSKREVFVCDAASCGKFYHPRCVARKLKPTLGESEALAKVIQAGEETFTCPLHRCRKCGKGEEKKERDLNLATCRRCPAAWHVKCLPRNLSFESNEESNYEIRAWELGKMFIVYCRDHTIIEGLGTPKRNHIRFPAPIVPSFVRGKIPGATQIIKKPQKKISAVGNEEPGLRAKASSSAVSEIPRRSVGAVRPATQHTPEDNYERIVDSIVERSKKKITLESELAKIFFPKNYGRKILNWMHHGRIDSILNGARVAVEKFNQGQNEAAMLTCPPGEIRNIIKEEEHLRGFLAPTLHGKRYTSYGRHFTKIDKLQKVVEKLQPHILDGDTIVDFSCGDNTFSRLLHDALLIAEKAKCRYKNFDIFPSKDTLGFECKDWFSVTATDCGPGDNLVIGLNPPFAHMYPFINHALDMKPRVLVLIVPPLKEGDIEPHFKRILDDSTTMAEKSFYLPGSVHGANDEFLEQGNTVPPHLYIFVRDTSAGPSQGNTVPPSTANPSQEFQQLPKSVNPLKRKRPPPPSDPLDRLFIPKPPRNRDPGALSARPQNRVVRAQRPGSLIEEGEILPPPPPRPTQFHDAPRQLSPRFGPHPPPVHHPPEEYSPFQPDLFPPGHGPRGHRPHGPRGHYPRSHGLRGPQRPVWHMPAHAFGPPRYPYPAPRYPPRHQNHQQFHHAPAASGDPAYSPGMPFRGQDEDEYGGWLD